MRPFIPSPIGFPSALCLLLAACAGRGGEAAGWQHQTTVEGDVTTVRTLSGSIWGEPARLVEEASIGSVDGADEYLFGEITGVVSDGERVYVLDRSIPVVRVYDWEGNHLLSFGRDGGGPGEFRNPTSMARHPLDGRVFVRDSRTGRINTYSPDGDPLEALQISSTFNTSTPFTMTEDGTLYTPTLLNLGADVTEWRMGMVSYGPKGTRHDTIPEPDFDFEPWRIIGRSENGTTSNGVPFAPNDHWEFATNRVMVGGISSEYTFEVRWPDGSRTVIERSYEPVPVQRDEARWHEKVATQNMRQMFEGWTWNGPAIPAHKPAYGALIPDRSGRVWVGREGPGVYQEGCTEESTNLRDYFNNPCWESEKLWDLFRMTGEYLGEVEVPDGLRISPADHIEGDVVIAAFSADDGTPYVKRYRLLPPSNEEE